MRLSRPRTLLGPLCLALAALVAQACNDGGGGGTGTPQPGANANASASPQQTLTETDRPQKIREQMQARGEQDQAAPALKIVSPAEGSTVSGASVPVRLELSGDLKGYMPHKDPATGMGNHIHVILDNEPYEAYYELGQPFELRNLSEGRHTLRVFASRPWHESYKNEGSFQMVTFSVRGGGNPSQPTTTNTGQRMADNRAPSATPSAAPSASPAPTQEGKDYAAKPNAAGEVDRTRPLLTYSRPKGEYKDADADAIMIDFWLSNARLDSGEYRVRYSVDGSGPKYITKWEPIWVKGWTPGKHRVKLELVDRNDAVVENGGYNSTEREITVVRQ